MLHPRVIVVGIEATSPTKGRRRDTEVKIQRQIQQLGWTLTVWENDDAQVRILLEHPVNPENPLMRSRESVEFLGENALGDAEDFVNDVVGYPNPFLGLIENGEGDELVEWQKEVQQNHRKRKEEDYDDLWNELLPNYTG